MDLINRLLHRSPSASPSITPEPRSGIDAARTPEHEIKVKFNREFVEVTDVIQPSSIPPLQSTDSLSSASSFQSLTSTLSTKSSSGICADSPSRSSDKSYANLDIPGLDDLLSACAAIHLDDSSADATFTSATDEINQDRIHDFAPDLTTNIETQNSVQLNFDQTQNNCPSDATFSEIGTSIIVESNLINPTSPITENQNTIKSDLNRTFDSTLNFSHVLDEKIDIVESNLNCTQDFTERFVIDESPIESDVNSTQNLIVNSCTTSVESQVIVTTDLNCTFDSAPETTAQKVDIESNEKVDLDKTQVLNETTDLGEFDNVILENQTNPITDEADQTFSPQSIYITASESVLQTTPENLNKSEEKSESTLDSNSLVSNTPSITDSTLSTLSSICVNSENEFKQPLPLTELSSKVYLEKTEITHEEFVPSAETSEFESEFKEPLPLTELSSKIYLEKTEIAHEKFVPSAETSEFKSEFKEPLPLTELSSKVYLEKTEIAHEEFVPSAETSEFKSEFKEPLPLTELSSKVYLEKTEIAHEEFVPSAETSEFESEFKEPLPPSDLKNSTETNTSLLHCEVEKVSLPNDNVSLSLTDISTVDEKTHSETSLEKNSSFSKVNEKTSKVDEKKVIDDIIVKDAEIPVEISLDQLSKEKASESIETFSPPALGNLKEKEEEEAELADIEKIEEIADEDKTLTLYETVVEQNKIIETNTSSVNIEKSESDEVNLPPLDDYQQFLPQRQSTSLVNGEILFQTIQDSRVPSTDHTFFDAECGTATHATCDFEKLKLEAQSVANDIYNTSLELPDDNEGFTTATTDLFGDPMNVDLSEFETANTNQTSNNRLRSESLYVKFDPLVSLNSSMMPQVNIGSPPKNDERNGDKDSSLPNLGSPKRNPAIAAIDRLLFYSPCPAGTIRKSEEPEKIEPTEKTPEPEPVIDSTMARELELVRSTVLQLEEQLEKERKELEKEKKERERTENKLQTQADSFQETINQLQKQLAQEINNKNQINVVVDEYEKSISRLIAERERDKKNLDAEKASIIEELQEAKNHLAASEVAFNDVHAKYERLKVVVTTSKSNEIALKESIAENVEIIKSLENRYEQIKNHAAARLEKANQDLDIIRKQHESESVRLRAMLRKEELKSNSLTELVEQKTKENKELTQILDEVIARVGEKSDE